MYSWSMCGQPSLNLADDVVPVLWSGQEPEQFKVLLHRYPFSRLPTILVRWNILRSHNFVSL